MKTYIPLISTRTKGPLGLVHLPEAMAENASVGKGQVGR